MRVLVIHGPNLNLLGERDPAVYGTTSLPDIDAAIMHAARELDIDAHVVQHSGEGAIIDSIHEARNEYDAIVMNAGAYSHYSYAIADAVASVTIPVIEVHVSNIYAREAFRRTSVVAPACAGSIVGFGTQSYILGLRAALALSSPMARKAP